MRAHASCLLLMLAVPMTALAFQPTPTTATAPTATGLLDGRTFHVQITDPNKPLEEDADELIFTAGTFRSVGCDKYGFKATSYTAFVDGSGWKFTTVTTSPEGGTIAWSGKMEANGAATGTFVWTKTGQAPITYTFAAPALVVPSKPKGT